MAREQDILKRAAPKRPPRLTSRRIGIHTSSAGGVQNAAERAYRLGCNTFQIFSSSPRQWAPYELGQPQCDEMNRLRARYDLKPLVIHTNYLVNLASSNELFLQKSMLAFRGEMERALSLCAEYLVLHPGSFRGADREQGLLRTAAAIAASTEGLDLSKCGLTILIENTAGAEFSLGGSFEQVAEVLERLDGIVPVGACIDTCHTQRRGIRHRQQRRHLSDAAASRGNNRIEPCESLALQRCEGGSRLQARSSSARGEGHNRERSIPHLAQRPAPGPCRVHCGNPNRSAGR